MSNRRRAKRPAMEPMQLDVLVVDHAGETAFAQSIPLDMPAFLFEKEMTYNVSVLLNPRKDAAAAIDHHLGADQDVDAGVREQLGVGE